MTIPDESISVYPPSMTIPSFREHHWVTWLKFFVDLVALQLALACGYILRLLAGKWWPTTISPGHYFDFALVMLCIPLGFWLMKLYPGYGLSLVERFRRKVRGTFISFMLFFIWDHLIAQEAWSRGVFLLTFLFALILPALLQTILRYFLIKWDLWGTPVVILGAGLTGRAVIDSLARDPSLGLRPIALCDDDQNLWGKTVNGVPVVGGIEMAHSFAQSVRYAILAMPGAGREKIVRLSEFLPFSTVIIIPDLLGLQSLWVEVRDLGGIPGMELQRQLLLKRNWYFKRFMDLCFSIPLFLISLPVILLSAACIRLVSPGFPFFTQEREGMHGKPIHVLKLRTMYQDAEQHLIKYLEENEAARNEWHKYFKLKKDPRILPFVGTFLRKTSLDELPQLWNVLRGEMSLVGPRPFPSYHLDEFPEAFRHLRRSVLPGVTGLWQVSARSEGDIVVQERLDTYYIRNWSMWQDILILAKTIRIVVTGSGAY